MKPDLAIRLANGLTLAFAATPGSARERADRGRTPPTPPPPPRDPAGLGALALPVGAAFAVHRRRARRVPA